MFGRQKTESTVSLFLLHVVEIGDKKRRWHSHTDWKCWNTLYFFPSEGSGHFFIIQNHVESFLLFPSSFFFPVFQSSKNRHSKGNFSSIRTRFVQNFWIVVDWIWKSSRRNFFSYQWFESISNWIEACKLMQILANQNSIQQFWHSLSLIPRIQALSLESIHIHLFLTLKTFLSYPLEMMFLAIKNPLHLEDPKKQLASS